MICNFTFLFNPFTYQAELSQRCTMLILLLLIQTLEKYIHIISINKYLSLTPNISETCRVSHACIIYFQGCLKKKENIQLIIKSQIYIYIYYICSSMCMPLLVCVPCIFNPCCILKNNISNINQKM